jgi:ABC-2 type transport system permease protein
VIGKLDLSFRDVIYILFGVASALIIFAFIGIIIAEITKEHSSNSGTLNVIFYGVIFLSDTFYPLTDLNPAFDTVVLFNPITPSLELARGIIHLVPLIVWIIALILVHSLFNIYSHLKR